MSVKEELGVTIESTTSEEAKALLEERRATNGIEVNEVDGRRTMVATTEHCITRHSAEVMGDQTQG